MAIYAKSAVMSGSWVKGSDVKSGVRAKLMSAATRRESQFKNEDGTPKMQDVATIRFEDSKDTMNIALNRATIDGLIEAFGENSEDWVGKMLTTQTEKMIVGGKRVTALYLLPEGFDVGEDANGYMVVSRTAAKAQKAKKEPEPTEPEEDEIKPEDIPFD